MILKVEECRFGLFCFLNITPQNEQGDSELIESMEKKPLIQLFESGLQ